MIRKEVLPEYASLFGAILVFTALSLSHFKLPHYLFVIAPLFAVLGAIGLHGHLRIALGRMHIILVLLLLLVAISLTYITFAEDRWPFLALLGATGIAGCPCILQQKSLERGLVTTSFLVMVAIGMVMNGHFYPHLLRYQANAQAGQWAAEKGLGKEAF